MSETRALAERGIVFANARSVAPWTYPSVVSLFSGLYPQQHGADGHQDGKLLTTFSADVPLLPQLFLPGPDGTLEARTDSPPLIRLLETPYPGRSVIPPDPARFVMGDRPGAAELACTIDGRPWVQRPFPYQRKCLGWLREAWRGLAPADQAVLRRHLAGTGCATSSRYLR